ncbi:sugar transferase [Evansella sp. AB-P1]|uniref:sugar transferase n=1 Tax=Evansella sp. AB-P1 TaxID=3037653 RepID=UPI00241E7574|nr:sugar transferase [Evansella sp. AB-P1]MDG5787886.1 sugar transferase [Evansella sp. AB-P1]
MSNEPLQHFKTLFLSFVDITMIHLGFLVAFWIYYVSSPFLILNDGYLLLTWISIVAFICFYLFDLYTNWHRKSGTHLMYTIVLSLLTYTIFLLFINHVIGGMVSIGYLVISLVIQTCLFLIVRMSLYYFSKRIHGRKRVLIIGEAEDEGFILGDKFLNHYTGWFMLKGFVSIKNSKLIKDQLLHVDVVLLSSTLSKGEREKLMKLCVKEGKEVLLVPQFFEVYLAGAKTQQIDDLLVFSIPSSNLSNIQKGVKRTVDIAVSVTLLIVLSPFIILLFFLIPLTSSGPALFKQERLGLNEQPFQLYKFRSMVQDAERISGPVLASEKDPRITTLGKILRATRLDELPQLFNVLKGEMSLIGPRPERMFFISQFKKQFPDYSLRFHVKPGITGLAQVLSYYSTTVEDKLRYDLMYVSNYSFIVDMKILVQTLRVVLQREHAKGIDEEAVARREKLLELVNQKRVINQ